MRPIYLRKIPHTVLKMISAQISWKKFFFEKFFFQGLGAFFGTARPLIWASVFSTVFFQVWLFNFNIILKTCLKKLYRKTVKNWWFYSFKQVTWTLEATLTPFRMGLFGAAHGWGRAGKKASLPKIYHTYPTNMKLSTVYLT